MDTFDPDLIRDIETMAYSEARVHCLDIIKNTKTKANKKSALLRDIQAAPNSKELSRIMWNVLLAGEGLITVNSAWAATYGSAKK
jgi:hypothetical protein